MTMSRMKKPFRDAARFKQADAQGIILKDYVRKQKHGIYMPENSP
jgi:hypothetical protein